MSRPRILDLFCGAGGAAVGYHRAGFEVHGVDLHPQPNYPFRFVQQDALQFLADSPALGERYDAIHASPPCQAFTQAQRLQGNAHPDLVAPVREYLIASGLPYVIENVPGAPLRDPVELCGAMFPPLRVYRHRLFECSFPCPQPAHPRHVARQVKMGRKPQPGEWLQVVGNFSGVAEARAAMQAPWMSRNELSESIPPEYTRYVGGHLMNHVRTADWMVAA